MEADGNDLLLFDSGKTSLKPFYSEALLTK